MARRVDVNWLTKRSPGPPLPDSSCLSRSVEYSSNITAMGRLRKSESITRGESGSRNRF